MADPQANYENAEYYDEDGDVGVEADLTKNAVQQALMNAREHRDANLTDTRKVGSRGSRDSRGSRVTPRPQVFYNPDNDAPDTRSSMTTTVSMAGEYRDDRGRPMQVVAIPHGAKLKTVGDSDSDSDDGTTFPTLTYESIQVNLGLLSDLDQDEKLHISADGTKMYVDTRYFQTGRRWYSGDSRHKTLRFIKHLYTETEKLCEEIVALVDANDHPKENTEKLMNLYGLIQGSARGLDRMNITYSDDKWCLSEIRTIKKSYETYCDRTLKGTIDGFKNNLR